MNERFEKLNSQLTETNLKNLENNQKDINNTPIIVDEQAKTWLSNNLNIDVNQIFSTTKKKISNQEFEENFEFKSTQPVVVLNENFSQKNYTSKKNDYVKMEENDNSFGMKKIREFMRKNNIKPNDVNFNKKFLNFY